MVKRNFSCEDVKISHKQLLKLRDKGHLNLGIEDFVATQISESGHLKPKKMAVSGAYHFWNALGIGVLGYGIYLSFASNWWWFILGLLSASVIWRVNKKSNSDNVLAAAFVDPEFYNKICELGGWIYQIEEREAERYLHKHKAE